MYICKICNKEFNSLTGLSNHIRMTHKIGSKDYFDKYLSIENEGICQTCGCKTKFLGLGRGYSKVCSNKCISRKHTTGYSGKCKICNKEFSSLEIHLNVAHNLNSKDYYDKYMLKENENICLNCGSETKFISLNKGYTKTCSRKCTFELKKKTETHIIKECLFCGNKFESLKSSNRFYCSEECFRASELPSEKRKITNMEKYNTNFVFQSKNVKDKTKDNRMKKYYTSLFSSDRLDDLVTPIFNINEYIGTKNKKYKFKCKKCDTIFDDTLSNGKIPMCPKCFPNIFIKSKGEEEIYDFLKSLMNENEIIRNDRKILNGLELDFYIPNKNIAIEFNGIYWHSEISGNKDKNYHLNKTKICLEHGIQLLHILDYEWELNKEIVKSVISSKFGIYKCRLFGRKCIVKEINNNDAKSFLDSNHLQGQINSKICLGLIFNNELVSLMTFGKNRFSKNNEWEMYRFCNKKYISIVGGASKLLSYFIKNYKPNKITTYADKRWSNGNLYEKIGFEKDNESNPDYFYFKRFSEFFHRLSFQKHKLKNKLEIFDATLTEWQNMQLNGYDRIWDCGNIKFIYG